MNSASSQWALVKVPLVEPKPALGPQKVLVTGATGFMGGQLVPELLKRGLQVVICGRKRSHHLEGLGAQWVELGDISGDTDWSLALEGVDTVIHLAGIAHRFESDTRSDWNLYDRVNHLATRSLAQALRASSSVKQFVFMSTIRVHGDPEAMPITAATPIQPVTPYDQSKANAERAIQEVLAPGAIHWAIFRPVLVYGPGNRGNLAKLESLIRHRVPVPATTTPNQKSFLFVGNLIETIVKFITTQEVPSGKAWLLADQEVVSTERLVKSMASAMNIRARFLRLPRGLYVFTGRVGDLLKRAGLPSPWNTETATKLLGDFYVSPDPELVPTLCRAPFSMEEGIRNTFASNLNE